jgi:hypothetical protein
LLGFYGYRSVQRFYRFIIEYSTDQSPHSKPTVHSAKEVVDGLAIYNCTTPEPLVMTEFQEDLNIVLVTESVVTLPGSRIDKLSIQTTLFDARGAALANTITHVPFGSPAPDADSDDGDPASSEQERPSNRSLKKKSSFAYSDWNGDHRWETYRIRPLQTLQLRSLSPIRLTFENKVE